MPSVAANPIPSLENLMTDMTQDALEIAGVRYRSRLLVGTGKYKDLDETGRAIEASGAEIVTVAIRRTNIGQNPDEPNLLDVVSPDRYTILPNTAGCYTAEEAVRTCRLARELLDGHKLVKLEVLADQKTLFPNVVETLKAAEVLIKDGFDVMVYTSDDPIIARELAAMGCVAVMPLAGLIAIVLLLVGSGGLAAMQTSAILVAAPFSIVMVLMVIATAKALLAENRVRQRAKRKWRAREVAHELHTNDDYDLSVTTSSK